MSFVMSLGLLGLLGLELRVGLAELAGMKLRVGLLGLALSGRLGVPGAGRGGGRCWRRR